jgi:paraquat-inducible protein A
MPSSPPATHPHLLECHDCGTFQQLPAMPPNARATCPQCDAMLRHTRGDPFGLPLALNLAALMMFGIGAFWTLLSVSTAGQLRDANLLTGPEELGTFGLWELSVVVLATTFAAPLVRILSMIAVLSALRLPGRPPLIRTVYAWIEHVRPWSMVEIFLLGLFVAYVRLSGIAHIDLGPAILALATLSVTMLAADIMLDPQAVWEALDPQGQDDAPHKPQAGLLGATLHRMGCDTCRLVTRGRDGALCPRCGFGLHHRKLHSLARTWALVLASLILYIPANTYPFLTVIRLGTGQPSTILQGVRELMDIGEWPLALLVFFASVTVPVLKLLGLILLLTTTMVGLRTRRRDRTVLYRVLDAVGRWSMIDIFMESILVALVQFGAVVTITPGPGAIAFAAVVILTMFAARTFDPRLIWDRAARDPASAEASAAA